MATRDSKVDGLHDIAWEKELDHPIHEDSCLAFPTGQLGEVDPAPHQPGEEAGKTDRPVSRQGNGALTTFAVPPVAIVW